MRKGLVILPAIFLAALFVAPAAADENSTVFFSAKAVISSFLNSGDAGVQGDEALADVEPQAPVASSPEAPERIKIDITVFEGGAGLASEQAAWRGNVRTVSLNNTRTLDWGIEQTPGWAKLHEFVYETYAAAISFDGARYKVVGVSLYVVEDDPTPQSILR